jgi:hypothetical protein
VLKKIFGPKRDKVQEAGRNFTKRSFIIYTSRQKKSKAMRWSGHVARMGAKRSAYIALVRKPKKRDY